MRYLTLWLLAMVLPVQAATLGGRIIHVADGDTVTVLDGSKTQHVVRLAGIDAPEKSQPYGRASRRALFESLHDREVVVDWHKVDRYGRLVGRITVEGRDANLSQLQAGLAWWYRAYAHEQSQAERSAYVAAEEQARQAGLGLWREHSPVAPWDFRRAGRSATETAVALPVNQ